VPRSETLANPRLWLAFAIMVLVSGIANAFPVFLPPLLHEFGGSRAATAGTVGIFWIIGGLLGPVTGRLVDRGDPRVVVIAGLVSAALGMAGAALAPTLVAFTMILGIGAGIGVGLTGMVTQAAVIADSYDRRRGFATGIAFAGSMFGYALATPAHWAIRAFGWRWTCGGWAFLLLALVPAVLAHYPARLAGRAPAAARVSVDRSRTEIVRTVPFWMLFIVFSFAPLVGYMMTVQHALYFTALGFSAGEAAMMLLLGGLLSTTGRALAGLAADRFGAEITGLASYLLSLSGALCLIGLEFWPARLLAYGYVTFVFLPLGSRATVVSMLVPRIAPPGRFGSVFGLLIIGNSVGAGLGPLLSGAIYDRTGSYLVIYAFAAALIAVAIASLIVFIRTAPRG
jgi:MFS family permease